MGRDIAKPDVQSALRGVSRGAGETASLALQGFSDDGSASPYTLLALYACSLIGGGFVVYSLPKLERDEPEPPSAVPPSSAERARGGGTTRVSDLPVR